MRPQGALRRGGAPDCGSEEEAAATAAAAAASGGASVSPAATAGLRHRAAERHTFRLEVTSERRERWDTET